MHHEVTANLRKYDFLTWSDTLLSDPSRLGVPRYQNIFRIILWILFLVCYTLAIQTPDREFGLEDYIFYVQVLGYTLEEIVRLVKIRSIAGLTFWTVISLCIYTIAFVALGFRIADLAEKDNKKALHYRLTAFQILSYVLRCFQFPKANNLTLLFWWLLRCAAPLVWWVWREYSHTHFAE